MVLSRYFKQNSAFRALISLENGETFCAAFVVLPALKYSFCVSVVLYLML
jgi:hypothetical protein